jgi:hypothetical protein
MPVTRHLSMINALQVRALLGKDDWMPPQPHGVNGWSFLRYDQAQTVIVSSATDSDGTEWIMVAVGAREAPTHEDLRLAQRAVFGDSGCAYQFFPAHNARTAISDTVLHLFGRADGKRITPDFST